MGPTTSYPIHTFSYTCTIPPANSSPPHSWDSVLHLTGFVHDRPAATSRTVCTIQQSVRYNRLYGTINLRELPSVSARPGKTAVRVVDLVSITSLVWSDHRESEKERQREDRERKEGEEDWCIGKRCSVVEGASEGDTKEQIHDREMTRLYFWKSSDDDLWSKNAITAQLKLTVACSCAAFVRRSWQYAILQFTVHY